MATTKSTRARAAKAPTTPVHTRPAPAHEALLDELMAATAIASTVARAMESSEEYADERYTLKRAVQRLYAVHSELDADLTAARQESAR